MIQTESGRFCRLEIMSLKKSNLKISNMLLNSQSISNANTWDWMLPFEYLFASVTNNIQLRTIFVRIQHFIIWQTLIVNNSCPISLSTQQNLISITGDVTSFSSNTDISSIVFSYILFYFLLIIYRLRNKHLNGTNLAHKE